MEKYFLWTFQLFTSLQNLSYQAQEQKAPTGKTEAFGCWTGRRPLLLQQMFQFLHSNENLEDCFTLPYRKIRQDVTNRFLT